MFRTSFSTIFSIDTYPGTVIILIRSFIVFCVAIITSLFGFLSSSNAANIIVFTLSCLLELVGVKHTFYKRILSTPHGAAYMDWENVLILGVIVLAGTLMWVKGSLAQKLPYMAGGIAALFTLHVLSLYFTISHPVGAKEMFLYPSQFLITFLIIKLYVRMHLVHQPA